MSEMVVEGLSGEQAEVLSTFSRTLNREAHVVAQHPDLLWQQMYNRLQWEEKQVEVLLTSERERRIDSGGKPWMHTKIPFRESEALLRTLTGHTSAVTGCAFSPDGNLIISASGDGLLKLWDAASGRELRTLSDHTDSVTAVAFSPDGTWIISASHDNTLKLWESASGQEWGTLRNHTDSVMAVAFSPDGTLVVSASRDKTLKLWEAASMQDLGTLPLLGDLLCVALHPWKPVAACGDQGGCLHFIELVGVVYGPIIVSSVMKKHLFTKELVIHCPACQHHLLIRKDQLGSELNCPTPGCGLRLKINPFVIHQQADRSIN